MKVQAQTSLEPPLEYNQDQMPLMIQVSLWHFSQYWELCKYYAFSKLVLERKTGREIPESSRLEFSEKFSANNFALSVAEDNTSGTLNRRGIADLTFLENTINNSPKVPRAKFPGNDTTLLF